MGNKSNEAVTSKILLLAIYSTGIIIGGGILALPFVALDSGIIFLMFILIILAVVFIVIYNRILESISYSLKDAEGKDIGLQTYDYALLKSGLKKWGKIAFTIGIILYVYPADIVYILYGLKSIIELSNYLTINSSIFLATLLLTVIFLSISYYSYSRNFSPISALLSKLFMMAIIWLVSISIVLSIGESLRVIMASLGFTISVIVGEYFPERTKHIEIVEKDDEADYEILPRHKAQAILTVFKVTLIVLVPLLAFYLIYTKAGLAQSASLFPRSIVSLVDSFSVIVFMYVGSGVYNILIYKWILEKINRGKKIVSLGVIISLIVYMIFTAIILLVVDASILEISDINREHAFIALSRKLASIGLSTMAYIVIGLASLFALVSVSVAYIGFTDTLSERLELDLKANRDYTWLTITFVVFISTTLLELFKVSKIATDALGVAGNAGGGLFLLIIPWLMVTKKDKGKPLYALIFLGLITLVNIFMLFSGTTLVAQISALIATILVVVFGLLTFMEWKRQIIK